MITRWNLRMSTIKINKFTALRLISIAFIALSLLLLVFQLIRYSQIRSGFPPGTKIAGVPVGGLDQQQAADRVTQAVSIPIELEYGEEIIQIKPASIGFTLNIDSMIATADQQRTNTPFWSSFWDYLWNRVPVAFETPLVYTLEEKRLRIFLMDEIASRYDSVPEVSQPIPGTVNFQLGTPGEVLDIDRSLSLIENALKSPDQRTVALPIEQVTSPKPSIENLRILLEQLIDRSNFDGLVEVYVLDLDNQKEINFAYENGINYPPGIAFTAASTIKIPIMVSIFKTLSEPTDPFAADLLQQMIEQSKNDPADQLMQTYLDQNLGPILVTDDMQMVGLENSFLAGYFEPGAPLLRRYDTPANLRTDYYTDPDPYNQTTTAEMGMLLADIYQCAKSGGGTFSAVFLDKVSQSECQLMVTYLTMNKIAVLLQAGLPDGTKIGHKHGWITETDGLMHAIFDAGVVYSDGGDYVISVAMYQPTQLIFDIANQLAARISTAVFNYFNITG